jgi:acyl-CoA thioester hydrolase
MTGRSTRVVSGSTTVRVRYAETDQMGVVYYANFFVWFEVGRCELLRTLGSSYRDLERNAGVALPVIEAHCEYRHPGKYDDALDVRVRGRMLSPARVQFDYEVVRQGDAAVLALGHTIHAAINADGRPCRLPEGIRALFS